MLLDSLILLFSTHLGVTGPELGSYGLNGTGFTLLLLFSLTTITGLVLVVFLLLLLLTLLLSPELLVILLCPVSAPI